MENLNKIPSRIKYYLLDYKDRNMEDYLSRFGNKRLNDLSLKELKEYFTLAYNKDIHKFLVKKDPFEECDATEADIY